MIEFLKKIYLSSLFLIIILLVYSCSDNKNNPTHNITHTFFNNFDNETCESIWKNLRIIRDDSAFSGDAICECPSDLLYAFGLNFPIDDSIGSRNVLFSVDMMLKSEKKLDAKFVFSIQRDNNNVLWKSYPLSTEYTNANRWYKNSFVLNVPNDLLKNSKLNCYILNDKNEHFFIDDFSFSMEYYNLPSYIDEIKESRIPNDLKKMTDVNTLNILYSKKENNIILADDKNEAATKPLSMFYSLIHDNDTIEIQSSDWDLMANVNNNYVFKNDNRFVTTQLTITYNDDNPNVNFYLESKYHKNINVLKSSLIIPFKTKDFTIYRKNPFVDTANYQAVYYLDKEGFSLALEDKQINLYHPDNVSSIQLDTEKSIAYINSDYSFDHLLIRYELLDTSDYFVDKSATYMKKDSSHNSSFTISLTNKTNLPRIMPIMDGYESAFIWTEHADWADIKTHRATYFGSEDVENIEDAVGGFAYYNIPVTKSVFYNNPDSVSNYEKNNDFPGLHSTIMTDSSFLDFLKQLDDNGFEICLHTPEQFTTTPDNLSEALKFMKDNFASPSWIDHGYNNSASNNRENMVCDGLDSASPYYIYDLWKENGVRFPFNASYEEMRPYPFYDYKFENNFMRPYPGFGDAFPNPKVSSLPNFPELLLWSTTYTIENTDNDAWNYYFNQEFLDKIVDYRNIFITHIYAPWVTEERGFWEMRDGKYVAKEGFNKALERMARMEKQHYMLATTIENFMTYQYRLKQLEYRVQADGTVVLKNKNKETIKGLSLISVHDISLDNAKHYDKRKTKSGNENIIWFDMQPNEEVRIVNNF